MKLYVTPVVLYLSRRNLLTLLSKLDRAKAGESTTRTIVKHDDQHPVYPATHPHITVTAVEDEDYYAERTAGPIHHADAATVIGGLLGSHRDS